MLAQEDEDMTDEPDPMTAPAAISPTSPERFINRELSWLAFNERVLEEARNPGNPLLERVRFLSISASNWDEFYMVRVAGVKAQIENGVSTLSQDGMTPSQQLSAILDRGARLMREQKRVWAELAAELRGEGIAVLAPDEVSDSEREWLEERYTEYVFPVLTPLAVDPGTAFPFIPNLGFCLFLQLRRSNGDITHALVPVPPQVERFVRLPGDAIRFVPLEDMIALCLDHLFPGSRVLKTGVFRVVRDSAMEIDERAEDLVETFESALKRRRRGSVIRLSINADIDPELHEVIVGELGVHPEDVYPREGILGLADIKHLIVDDRPDLLYPPYTPRFPERIRDFGDDVFAAIRAKDFVVHHPYESFDAVIRFVTQAARDPDVVAIKQTLYRTSSRSPIVAALIEAAEAGKQVTAVVELKARFDEEANIRWARELEDAGVHVVYGFLDKKIHAKINLVIRRESGRLRGYAHFGTGNYHPITARIYTDLSLFTCDAVLCRDASKVFNYMTGFDPPKSLDKLAISPTTMRPTLMALIEGEVAHARAGHPATIWIKSNALIDNGLIDALYEASRAGVKVCAIVRGICGLRPGVPGLSDNIEVRSIVGRFLEHSRIFVFGGGHALPSDEAKVFISSADWMQRNINRRIELLVPVENVTVHRQILNEIMATYLKDTTQSWTLASDGSYHRVPPGRDPVSAHRYFMTNPSLSGRGSAAEASA